MLDSPAASRVSSGSWSSSSRPGESEEKSVVQSERTFCRPSRPAAATSPRATISRPIAVFFGDPQHRVLHDIERGLLVAYGEHRLLERASLDAFKKRR